MYREPLDLVSAPGDSANATAARPPLSDTARVLNSAKRKREVHATTAKESEVGEPASKRPRRCRRATTRMPVVVSELRK